MIVVIGTGIVGAAVAARLSAAGERVVVLDKEPAAAAHQSGRNSGVVHSGIYYRHGSVKQRTTATGRAELARYVAERDLPWRAVPKLIVATEKRDVEPLRALERNARDNGIPTERLGLQGIADAEPGIVGRAALRVTTTAITDFAAVTRSLLDDVRAHGGEVRSSTTALGVTPAPAGERGATVTVAGSAPIEAESVIVCAGLGTVPLARSAGIATDIECIPFRGAYWTIDRRLDHLVYPVADPRYPFLGAHFTPTIDGHTHVGPTATPALGPEAYRRRDVDLAHLSTLVRSPAMRRLAAGAWRDGIGEMARSTVPRLLVERCRRLMPDLAVSELRPAPAGIRAQAIRPDGTLVDDFVIGAAGDVIAVLNAPSPAATASLAIGAEIASDFATRRGLR